MLVCGLLMACSFGAQEPPQEFWNMVFTDSTVAFNHQPSRLLVEAVRGRKPGAAIDLGMGQGRNAIFLAQQGWRVTGVDFSEAAVARAKQRAAKLGVPLETHVVDLDQFADWNPRHKSPIVRFTAEKIR